MTGRTLFAGAAVGAFLALVLPALVSPAGHAQYPAGQPATALVPYNGAAVDGKPSWTGDDVRRTIAFLKSIDERLAAIEAGPARAPGALTQLSPLKVATTSGLCVNCHTPAATDAKGGGFVLFTDDAGTAFRPLSARDKVKIKDAVESGQMPPPAKGRLSPAEKAAFQFPPAVSNKEVIP